MSGTQSKRDDKMFFGAQTPFRPKRGIEHTKKATGMLIQRAAKPLSYLVFHNGAAPVKGE